MSFLPYTPRVLGSSPVRAPSGARYRAAPIVTQMDPALLGTRSNSLSAENIVGQVLCSLPFRSSTWETGNSTLSSRQPGLHDEFRDNQTLSHKKKRQGGKNKTHDFSVTSFPESHCQHFHPQNALGWALCVAAPREATVSALTSRIKRTHLHNAFVDCVVQQGDLAMHVPVSPDGLLGGLGLSLRS